MSRGTKRSRIVCLLALALSVNTRAHGQTPKPLPFANSLFAQNGQAPAAPARPVSSTPQATSETYGDWVVVCSAAPAGTVCEADSSLSVRGQQGAIARIGFARTAKDKPMRLLVQTPVSIAIAPGVRVDPASNKNGAALSYRNCTPGGCFADADLSSEQLQAFRAAAVGDPGKITLTDATGRTLELAVSFRGLDVALDALAKK